MKTWITLTAGALLLAANLSARAETSADAKAMLEAAVGELKAKGSDAAIKEFNAGGKWRKGTIYVVVVDFTGHMRAHSVNEKLVGKNLLEVKDASGKPFIQEVIQSVKASGAAEIDLRWANPSTKKIDDGVIVAKKVPGEEAYVGALAFK